VQIGGSTSAAEVEDNPTQILTVQLKLNWQHKTSPSLVVAGQKPLYIRFRRARSRGRMMQGRSCSGFVHYE
jgi:hypothetical protein